jgi:hypothetical protein
MGYLPAEASIYEGSELLSQLTVYKESYYVRNLVLGYAAQFPEKVVELTKAII